MLLRRITQHVKDQNWFAVLIDFVIVVFGVFIGIQVANWNDARADQRLGLDYERRLIADLKQDLEMHEISTVYYQAVLESIVDADQLLNTPSPDPKSLILSAYRASEIRNATANRATWDQIVSSGHIGLLPEYTLEAGLDDYYKYDRDVWLVFERIFDSEYRKLVRSIIPLPVQLEIRGGCSDVVSGINVIVGFVETCEIDIDDETLSAVAEALKSSPSLKEELRFQYSGVSSGLDNSRGNKTLVQNILDTLEPGTGQ